MTLEELKTKLESLDKGSDLYDTVVDLINEEKERGKTAKHKANGEAQNLRAFKKSLEALGFEGDSDEVDSFTASLLDKITNANSTGDTNTLTLKSLQAQLKKMNGQLETEQTRSRTLETKAKSKTIAAKLTDALSDKVYGGKYLINSLISDGRVDMDGDTVVFKNGDEVISFEDGVTQVLEENKDIVRTAQTPGSGLKNAQEIPKNIASIIDSGDKNAIRANLAEIKASLGISK